MRALLRFVPALVLAASALGGSWGLANEVLNPGFEDGLAPWEQIGGAEIRDQGIFSVPVNLVGGEKFGGGITSWGGDWNLPISGYRQVVDNTLSPGWDPDLTSMEIDFQFDFFLGAWMPGDPGRSVGIQAYLDWMDDGSYPDPVGPGYHRELVWELFRNAENNHPGDLGYTWEHVQINQVLPVQPEWISIEFDFTAHFAEWSFIGVDNVDFETGGVAGPLVWDGGAGSWADDHWNGGQPIQADAAMIIDHDDTDPGPNVVTVDADFTTAENGPAVSVTLGETNLASLIVDHDVTLEVTGDVVVGDFGTLTVDGTLRAGSGSVAGTLSGGGTIYVDPIESITVTGTVAPGGDDIGTLTLGSGEMRLDTAAAFNAQVSLAVVNSIEPDKSTKLATDRIVLSDDNVALQIGGTLAISSLGDRANASYWATSPVLIDNPLRGPIGDTSATPHTGRMFDVVTPAPPASGEAALHLGQGLFLRDGTGVTYATTFGSIIDAVQLDVFVALGGDADGDGKVWLSDWAALRANFGNTGTGKTWTEGNFDPWEDEKVWLSDWAALRANFGNSDYTLTEGGATAVPEPGTIAMLLGALAGLAVLGWRRR